MYIDDLVEAIIDFEHVIGKVSKLEEKKIKALETINKDIHIRDLIVKTKPKNPYLVDEINQHANQSTQPVNKRLRAHISSIFSLANEDHRKNYCIRDPAGNYSLLSDKTNHITRLSMNEFSL